MERQQLRPIRRSRHDASLTAVQVVEYCERLSTEDGSSSDQLHKHRTMLANVAGGSLMLEQGRPRGYTWKLENLLCII